MKHAKRIFVIICYHGVFILRKSENKSILNNICTEHLHDKRFFQNKSLTNETKTGMLRAFHTHIFQI